MAAPTTELALPEEGSHHGVILRETPEWMLTETDRRIGTPYEFRVAAEALVDVRRELRRIAAKHDPAIKASYAEHKAANEAKRAEASDLAASETALAEQVAHYLRTWAVDDDRLVPVNDQVPVIEGLGYSIRYRPVVKDVKKLLNAIARGKVSIDAISVNEKWLRERVTAMRETFNVPGCGYELVVTPIVTEPEKP